MTAHVCLWGWDKVNSVWVKLLVNADGKPIIDPSEIFENPPTDGETGKGAQSDWCYDHWKDPDAHHNRQHALDSALDHTGEITDTQHGERTKANAHAHSHLSGIGASDHHAKYTDAEAKTAAVSDEAYGAGWNGVTDVAPSKNAVYDKIETLGGTAIASGSYTGDSTVNRAIPHGLGVTPKIVLIKRTGTAAKYQIFGAEGNITYELGSSGSDYDVTIPDSTNFYVGNATGYVQSANNTGTVYYWVAIG